MKVYRCYDNRLRCTERRPDVYEHCPSIQEHCNVALHITDALAPNDSHPFGQLVPKSYTDAAKWDWLWNFKGQLKVIATPYHEGKHYATHPNQFLPIVDRLEEMHKSGYVHGDIRAYNMVLNYDDPNHPNGWFIDFDFGGRIIDLPKYPSGYVQDLSDGFRLGEPGKSITFEHDWYALGQVIFVKCFTLSHPDPASVSDKVRLGLQIDLPREFLKFKDDYSLLQGGAVTFLRDYLRNATEHGFEFEFVDSFNKSLQDCNLIQQTK